MNQIIRQTDKHLQNQNNMDKCFSVGAEAIISKDNNKIIKNRIKKSYRIKEIDDRLRKSRTKSEAKIINKLQKIIPVPKILESDDKQKIVMEYIKGEKLSDNLEKLDYPKICKLVGENIAKVHNQNIIHGDLTTSNMIYVKNELNNSKTIDAPYNQNDLLINDKTSARLVSMRNQSSNINQSNKSEIADSKGKLYFIDFGLAFHSSKIEDKAVDLHLIQQALEAKHFTIWQECTSIILKDYEKKANQGKEILQRIKVIESRGRYKDKY